MSARDCRAPLDAAGSSSGAMSHHVVDELARHLDVALEADVAVVEHVALVRVERVRSSTRVAPGGIVNAS